jgi:very-short-patch-repair endonuclease
VAAFAPQETGRPTISRQHPIDRFIVDFYCAEHEPVVEIDGAIHATQAEYDEVRTGWLEARGHRVLRFANQEVRCRLHDVLEAIRVARGGGS